MIAQCSCSTCLCQLFHRPIVLRGAEAAATRHNDLRVLQPNDAKYDVIASYKVADSPTWAHPVVVDGQILVKDKTTLALWSLRP